MKKIIVLVFLFFLSLNICFSQSGWYQLQSGTAFTLRDVYFINEFTGWVVGDSGRVLMTTTGGTNWTTQIIGNPGLYTVNFANSSTGYIGGGLSIMGYTGVSYLYKTTNQGLNWFFTYSGYGADNLLYISSISIISPDIIFATTCGQYSLGGSVGDVKKSTNGGVNFATGYGVGAHKSVCFINEQTGWTLANYADDIGKRYAYILKTTNSGTNWAIQIRDSIRYLNFGEIKFFNENTGYALGVCSQPNRTLLFKSSNGGVNWDTLVYQNSYSYSMFFQDANTGWMCGIYYGDTSCIIKTTNGGLSWTSQKKGYLNISKIFMVNDKIGYASGSGGMILKTISGGVPIDTSAQRYFPMAVGNVYTYAYTDLYSGTTYLKGRITKDSVILGHRYYYTLGIPGISSGNWVRYDTLSGNLLALYPGNGCGIYSNDKIIDSLSSRINDTLNYCTYYGTMYRKCTDTATVTLFGNFTTKKKGFTQDGLIVSSITYAKNIGICSYGSAEPPPITGYSNLTGCKVNGIVYGDTNVYYLVSGSVKYSDNNQPVTNGYVKAIKLDKNTGNVIIVDSTQIQSNGTYILHHIPQDSVDIGVYPNSTPPNDYVITYYPSSIYWQNATTLYPTVNLTNVNIIAYRMSQSTNSNSVNGKVMRLTFNPYGNLKDAVLYAKSGNTFVGCAVTDGNGIYHMPSLPAGNLKIIVDRLGFTGDSTNRTLTATSNIDSVNFYLNRMYVGIKQVSDIMPSEYKLYQNYPNPFNPFTNIKYQITNSKLVTLRIYDILGKEITTLVNEKQSPGVYEVTFDGGSLPSGIYFYKLMAEDFSEVRRMILIK